MNPELVVMAAGLGSRFGGLKQLEGVGPSGETLMDYALHDAWTAGVRRVVFVIRPELEEAFRPWLSRRYGRWLEVDLAFQRLEDLPAPFTLPAGRTRPWGTGQAVLAAAGKVQGPFLVSNADDFYGAEAFQRLVEELSRPGAHHALAAFALANTLSPHGTVARGVCELSGHGELVRVVEHTGLRQDGAGAFETAPDGSRRAFTGREPVSMNLWGFRPSIFPELASCFAAFLAAGGDPATREFFLPAVVDGLIQAGTATVKALSTTGRWFGITYQDDLAAVRSSIRQLVASGAYPLHLWD